MIWNDNLKEAIELEDISSLPKYAPLYVLKNIGRYKTIFILLTLVSISATLFSFGGTYILSEILNELREESLNTNKLIQYFLPIYIFIVLAGQSLDYLTRRYAEVFPEAFRIHQLTRFIRTIHNKSTSQLFNYSKEKLNIILGKYLSNVDKFLSEWFWSHTRRLTQLVLIIIILLIQNWVVFAINFVYFICLTTIIIYISKQMSPLARAETKERIEFNSLNQNIVSNISTIKKLRILDFTISMLRKQGEMLNKTSSDSHMFHAGRWFLQFNLFNIIFIGTFFFGIYQVIQGEFELGFLLLIKYAFDNLVGIIIFIAEYSLDLIKQREDSALVQQELNKILDTNANTSNNRLPVNTWSKLSIENANIKIHNTKDKKTFTISIPNLELRNGELVAITGPSGSGKSTLFNILLGIQEFSGKYLLDDKDATHTQIPSKMTLISNDDPFFNISIRENITLGKITTDKQLNKILDLVEAEFVDDLDLVIGERNTNFSSGQLQRLRLARGLIQDSEIYLFDEAFNGIDKTTKNKITKALVEFLKNRTAVFISHNEDEIDFVNKKYIFKDHVLEKIK